MCITHTHLSTSAVAEREPRALTAPVAAPKIVSENDQISAAQDQIATLVMSVGENIFDDALQLRQNGEAEKMQQALNGINNLVRTFGFQIFSKAIEQRKNQQ